MERHFCLDDSPTFRMIALNEVDSTNSFLRRLDTQGDRRMTLVTAEYQSAGRGAGTNHWESARGENLLLSLRVMPSRLPALRAFAISEATALAVMETIDSFSLPRPLQRRGESRRQFPPPLEGLGEAVPFKGAGETLIKWPNDIYFGDSKVAGMLIENNLQGALVQSSIIGIGINVNQRRFLSDAPNPRSLADIAGRDINRRLVLEQFMERFSHYMRLIDEGKEDKLEALHRDYKKHLYRFGEEHDFCDEMGVFCAKIVDVEQSGHLVLLDKEGNLRRYEFKEVRFVI